MRMVDADEDVDQGSRSLIDLNRCGVGLMEIVFAPDLYDGEQAVGLVRELSLILRSVGSCSCAMEDGALRVDANISVMPSDSDQLGVRTEVKNINSLRNPRPLRPRWGTGCDVGDETDFGHRQNHLFFVQCG